MLFPPYGFPPFAERSPRGIFRSDLIYAGQCGIRAGEKGTGILAVEDEAEPGAEHVHVGDAETHAVYVDKREFEAAPGKTEKDIARSHIFHIHSFMVHVKYELSKCFYENAETGTLFDAPEFTPAFELAAYKKRTAQTPGLSLNKNSERFGSSDSEAQKLKSVVVGAERLRLAEKTVNQTFRKAGNLVCLDIYAISGKLGNDIACTIDLNSSCGHSTCGKTAHQAFNLMRGDYMQAHPR